jgi:hypothetical protein
MSRKALAKVTEIGGQVPTNGAKETIDLSQPYIVKVKVQGSADLLFHRWNPEAVDEKAKAAKGSKAKKSDNIESYVYRCDNGNLGIPGEYLRQCIIHAAKFRQDPRSPRKSAMDLFKAGIVSLTTLADLGKDEWDYEHRCRVVIQRNAINRTRPALKQGWKAVFEVMVNLPEYINPDMLNEVIQQAGRLIGMADFRPSYGRFAVTGFEVMNLE